jgi:hypothetical protein
LPRFGVDEPLSGDAIVKPALEAAHLSASDVPMFVRVVIDVQANGAPFDYAALDRRVAVYAASSIPVVLTFTALPASPDQTDTWRTFVRATAERYRGKIAAYQIGSFGTNRPAAHAYAFDLKLASVQIRSVDPDALITTASVPPADAAWLEDLYREDVSAYVDVVAMDAAAGDAAKAEAAMRAVIEREDPTAASLVTALPLGADGHARRAWVVGQFGHLGARPASVSFTGSAAALASAFESASTLKDMLTGEVVTLDEEAASLKLTANGRDVTGEVPHRLLYNLSNFSTYLVYWVEGGAASSGTMRVQLKDAAGRAPMLRDALAGSVAPARNFAWDKPTTVSSLEAPLSDNPVVIDFNFGAGEVYVDRADVSQKASLKVDEIIFRYQQAQAAQDALYRTYVANARMEQHFRPSNTDSVDVVTDNRFFFDRGAIEWEELSFSVNGAKWGPNRPSFPLLQAEKVLSLPMDLRLDRDYTYKLDGTDKVGGRLCYVVRFDPVVDGRSLYRGRVWIDAERFVRMKVQAVQTHMTAPVVSNEEIQTFDHVADVDGRPLFLFTHLVAKQIFLIAGRNLLVEKEVRFSDFQVDSPSFGELREAARASDRVMYRDTDAGLRYFVKRGEQRVVSDQMTMSAKAMAIGTTVDPSFDFPLPILGINYLDFDFLSKDSQLALLFGGVLALGNIQQPKLWHTPLDASVDFFGIAVPGTDTVFDSRGERKSERVLNIPSSAGVNVGYQFTSFQKVSANYVFRHDFYFHAPNTDERFVLPSNTSTNGIGFTYDYKRRGYSLTATASRFFRTSWRAWGLPESAEPVESAYDRYQVSLSKDFFFNTFHKVHVNGAYFGGERLDRFSQYQFGLFDDTRMHGVPASGVRFGELAMARGSYSFNIFEQYRLDVFVDRAWGRDPFDRRRWLGVTGTGVAVNLRGPMGTLFKADVGKSFLPGIYAGSGSFVLQIMMLKPL